MSHNNGPPVPSFILRGHAATIHALHFFAVNAFLASADSDGWVVIWSLASKRAVAVWKAHASGILAVNIWGQERLVTHGRDHKLRVWKVGKADLERLNAHLPVDGAEASEQKQPWLLHSMDVNALNFCAFAMCRSDPLPVEALSCETISAAKEEVEGDEFAPVLIAAPNALDSGGIDIFQLPSERRLAKISSDKAVTTGMVMALRMVTHPITRQLTVISGYEDGQTMVYVRTHGGSGQWLWKKTLLSKPHSQPLLSIDVSPAADSYFTSSADAVISKFAIPLILDGDTVEENPIKSINTKHAGQQGLVIRSDGKIFATAGWDARVRVYSATTVKELAVLKWHKEGCYAVSFAHVTDTGILEPPRSEENAISSERNALDVIRAERDAKAQKIHWLAAGGKDAKISLWNIY